MVSGPTAAEVGRYLGLTRQRVSALRDSGLIHGATVAEQTAAYCASLREQVKGGDDAAILARERALLARAQRQRIDRQAEAEAGQWIRRADACAQARRAGMTARDAMLAVPGRIAAELAALGG